MDKLTARLANYYMCGVPQPTWLPDIRYHYLLSTRETLLYLCVVLGLLCGAMPVQNTLSIPRFALGVFKMVSLLRALTVCYGWVKCGGGRSQRGKVGNEVSVL
ncbi:unnamed protein product [Ascophyllum nodosum]